jgi:hypothetical protein
MSSMKSQQLVHREERYFHRKFKESLLIKKTPHRLNRDLGMEINPIWQALLLPMTCISPFLLLYFFMMTVIEVEVVIIIL